MRARLRDATQADHRRVDALFAPLDLADRGDYGVFLVAHAQAMGVISRQVPHAETGVDVEALYALLSRDINLLGASVRALAEPRSAFSGHPLGVGYVLAGSHFGARMLSRHVAASNDRRVRAACAYLTAPGLRAEWPAVLERLAQLGDEDWGDVLCAARWCFAVFEAAGQAHLSDAVS
jgi:heme oxygenase